MNGSNTRTLTPDERMEYEEIGRCARHDMDIVMEATKIMVPVALGMVPLAAARPDLVLPIGFASVLLYFNYCSIVDNFQKLRGWRLDRGNVLEEAAGLDHYRSQSRKLNAEGWRRAFRAKYIRWAMLFLLIGAYVWIALHGMASR